MLMSANAMGVPMADLRVSGCANFNNIDIKLQSFASKRVIRVNVHHESSHLYNRDLTLALVGIDTRYHAFFPFTGTLQVFDGHALYRSFDTVAVAVFWRHRDIDMLASLFAFYRAFKTRDHVLMTLKIGNRVAVASGFDLVTLLIF